MSTPRPFTVDDFTRTADIVTVTEGGGRRLDNTTRELQIVS